MYALAKPHSWLRRSMAVSNYRIVESGRLEYTLELPEREPCTLISEFVLRERVRLHRADACRFLFRFTVILEHVADTAGYICERGILALRHCIEQGAHIPLLTIGDTVYLAETDEDGFQ